MADIESSSSYPKGPLKLITTGDDYKLHIVDDTATVLSRINRPMLVVVVAGKIRSGKSFLMNKLAESTVANSTEQHQGKPNYVVKDFEVGHKVKSHTKGIWAWPMPHPKMEGTCLLLLDTEGLGDIQKANDTHDTWLFVMAMLLCNVLVFNTRDTLDHVGLEQLRRVKNVTEHVKSKVRFGGKDSTELQKYCPTLVICLRDFSLDLENDGSPRTADEYMEECFNTRKPGTSPEDKQFNDEYDLMCTYFKNRKCFTFPMPSTFKLLKKLDKLPDSDGDLDKDFIKTLNEFKSHIHSLQKYKNIEGVILNGERFVQVARCYVEAQQMGKDVYIEEVRQELVERTNGKIFLDAKEFYEQKIKPMETQFFPNNDKFYEDYGNCMLEAHQLFLKGCVLDPANKHQMKLLKFMAESREKMLKINDGESRKRCENRLAELSKTLHERCEDSKSYENMRYTAEMEKIMKAYQETMGLGEMKEKVLLEFMQKEFQQMRLMSKNEEFHRKEIERQKERLREQEKKTREKEKEDQRKAEKTLASQMERIAADHGILLKDIAKHTDEDTAPLMKDFSEKLSWWQEIVQSLRLPVIICKKIVSFFTKKETP